MRMMPGVDYDPDDQQVEKQEPTMEQEEHTPSIRDELNKLKDSSEDYSTLGTMEMIEYRLNMIDTRIHELLSVLVEERTMTKEQAIRVLERRW